VCHSAAVSGPFVGASDSAARITRILAAGAATALVALAGFAVAHAFLIAPIWTQLLRGVPFALLGATGLAWAFDELSRVRGHQSVGSGVAFGGVMFLTMVPAAALDAGLRLTGLRGGFSDEVAAVILAVASGTAAGWLMTRRRRASFAFAVAALLLTFTSAGPLPMAQSIRGAWLSLAIAPICLISGAVLATVHGWFSSQNTL
jgi:hypothetical protein